jgi:DNA-binding transcriptional LysR family regulator
MDRIEQYRVFLQVAELGSFIQAARVLKLPRATVSAAVQKLEADVGTRLLHRTTRKVSLTSSVWAPLIGPSIR